MWISAVGRFGLARFGPVFNGWACIAFMDDIEKNKVKTWAEWLEKEEIEAKDLGDLAQAHIFRCLSKGWKYIGPSLRGTQDWEDMPDTWLDLDGKHQGTGQPMGEIQP